MIRPLIWILALLIALPLFTTVVSLGMQDNGTFIYIIKTSLSHYLVNSTIILLCVTTLTATIGITTAWWITRYNFPLSKLLEWMMIFPLAIPSYVLALAYNNIELGPAVLKASIILGLALYPYVYMLARIAFLSHSEQMLDTARTLGVNESGLLRRVALPLARPAIIAGIALVAMETLADFGVVYLYGVDTFTTAIYRTWFNYFDPIAAAKLASLLVLAIIVVLWCEHKARKQANYANTTALYQPIHKIPKSLSYTILCLLPVTFGALIPIMILIKNAMASQIPINWLQLLTPLMNSILLAIITLIAVTVVALLFVHANRSDHHPFTKLITNSAALGYAIPGSVIAVGILIPLTALDRWIGQLFFSGTMIALVYAYTVRFLTLGFNSISAQASTITPTLDAVAKTLGAGQVRILKEVHMPLLKTAMITSGLMIAVDVIKELPATLIIRPFNMDTLAITTFELASDERYLASSAPALMLIAVGLIPVIILSYQINTSRPGSTRP